jgi:hypothetical protein
MSTDKPVGATLITWHEAGQIVRARLRARRSPLLFISGEREKRPYRPMGGHGHALTIDSG